MTTFGRSFFAHPFSPVSLSSSSSRVICDLGYEMLGLLGKSKAGKRGRTMKPSVFRCSVAQGQASRLPTKHLRRVRHYCIRPPYSQEMSRQLFCQVNIDTPYFVHRCR